MGEKWVGFVLSLFAIAILASPAFAECPEGKNEVLMVTPSGIQKTLCIPNAAIIGIETAADHSAGSIVTTECPCYPAEQIDAMYDYGKYEMICSTLDGISFDCDIFYVADGRPAENPDAIDIYRDQYGNYVCFDQLNKIKVSKVSQEEINACASILDQYVAN